MRRLLRPETGGLRRGDPPLDPRRNFESRRLRESVIEAICLIRSIRRGFLTPQTNINTKKGRLFGRRRLQRPPRPNQER